MDVLVLGGSGFIGRHIVESLLASGNGVTIFDRGSRGRDLFAGATHVIGDRDFDLGKLTDSRWDATVDLSAYLPRQVKSLADELGGRLGTYVLLSSTAIYAPPQEYGFREAAPKVVLPDPATEEVNWDTYGGLKALCEKVAADCFPAWIAVRPTYVVGPSDFTGRFTYWVERIARGGEVLAPGPYDLGFQLIDVQDLAPWIVGLLARGATGAYQAASPFPPAKFGDVLQEIAKCVAPPGTRLTWVDRDFLLEAGQDGGTLPLWPGANPEGVIEAADPGLAVSTGLAARPLAETIRLIHEHESRQPTPVNEPVGLTAEAEAELLARWQRTR
jgi:2'-hydroxyisoflavone reductase